MNWHSEISQLGYQAEWRREKAEQYPDDFKRNLKAAAALAKLAADLLKPEYEFQRKRIEKLLEHDDNNASVMTQAWSEWTGNIYVSDDVGELLNFIIFIMDLTTLRMALQTA